MRNVFLVVKFEVLAMLRKPSFWLMTFLFPVGILAYNVVGQLLVDDMAGPEYVPGATETPEISPVGLVDHSGIVVALPQELPDGLLQVYAHEGAATAALAQGEIDRYYLVSADYVTSGGLELVSEEFSLLSAEQTEGLVKYVLDTNLLGDESAARLLGMTRGDAHAYRGERLAPGEPEETPDEGFGFAVVPYAAMFIVFFVIASSGGYVLQSVAGEKENRTVEVLLLSIRPRSLMLGKVLGLGFVSLLQIVIWVSVGGLVLDSGQAGIGLAEGANLAPGFAVYALGYGLAGYVLYSSMLSAIGAMAPNVREATQFQVMVLAPLMLPFMLNYVLFQDPNGTLSVVLSLIPFTAPVAMILRLTAVPVPLWQTLTSLAGLIGMAYVFVLLSARFFRPDTLLSGAKLSVSRMVQAFRGESPE